MDDTRYSALVKDRLREEEQDLDDGFSDSTKLSAFVNDKSTLHRQSEDYLTPWEGPAQRSTTSRIQPLLTWIRWFIVVTLQIVIIIMLFLFWQRGATIQETDAELQGRVVEAGGDINGLWQPSENRSS